jgi:dTDP-4-amino-4,6-dideoxygalactose transaminase
MIRLTIPDISDDDIRQVGELLKSGYWVQGKTVAELESAVSNYLGIKHAVAVSSGTAALHLALRALSIDKGDEVIIPDFTFPATANVVKWAGAEPVVVDIDPKTLNLDPGAIEKAVTKRTKAIMPVHQFGIPCNIDAISAIAGKYDLSVIEDAACALGSFYKKKPGGLLPCGTFGIVGCFSFHPRKIIATGEGGMLVTHSDAIAHSARLLRNHGISYDSGRPMFTHIGFNYRMTEIEALLGLQQMKKIDAIIENRRMLASIYNAALKDFAMIRLPDTDEEMAQNYQSYVVLLKDSSARQRVMNDLRAEGIETTIGAYAIHREPAFFEMGLTDDEMPHSTYASDACITLPLHAKMNRLDIEEVAACLQKVVSQT